MPDHPIIFSAPMVLALLAGRKTQTRRLTTSPLRRVRPGDRLWVRESVQADTEMVSGAPLVRWLADNRWALLPETEDAEERHFRLRTYRSTDPDLDAYKPVPAIHMPRWASRLTLTVTATRTERARSISREDAIAEGVIWSGEWDGYCTDEDGRHFHASDPRESWWSLFSFLHRPATSTGDISDAIEGRPAWNPDVLALTFTVEQRNIDA